MSGPAQLKSAVRMTGVSKNFGGVRALSNVDLEVHAGEIHALLGGNGAGKSTILKILRGVHAPTSGTVEVNGRVLSAHTPEESKRAGVAMIFQEMSLVPTLTVAQNIFLGRWPRRGAFVDRRRMYAEAAEVMQRLKVDVNSVFQKVESLSGGRQQSVAIARAISFEPKLIVLDEPTANLSVTATQRLLETMRELKSRGVAQIIISHRLTDIFEVGDRVMVLKRGQNVGERSIHGTTEHDVLQLIVAGTPKGDHAEEQSAGAGA